MNSLNLTILTVTTCGSCFQSGAAVIISEVLYNEVGSDARGEWIEIYNNGSTPVVLNGWSIGDEETQGASSGTESLYRFPAGAIIAAGEIQIISAGGDRFLTVYGFLPNYEIASSSDNAAVQNLIVNSDWDPDGGIVNLSNSNDQVLLFDDANELVDAVSWGSTFAFNPSLDANAENDGQSYHRIDPQIDTDSATDWALTTGSALSSPGAIPEPTSGVLLFLSGILLLGRRRS